MRVDERAEQLRREYYRKWRELPKNKEKIKQYTRRYWRKKAIEVIDAENHGHQTGIVEKQADSLIVPDTGEEGALHE